MRVFVAWIANAVYHSLVLYVFGVLLWPKDGLQGNGRVSGHWVWGTSLYGAVLLTVLGKAGLITNNWTKYHVIAIPGSMALFIGFIAAYATVAPLAGVSKEYHGLVPVLFSMPMFWLQMVVLPVLCLSRDVAYKYGKRMYKPQTYHHIQEIQKYNIQDYRPRYVAVFHSLPIISTPLTSCVIQHGAVPKSHSQGPHNAAEPQTARLRLLAGRRVPNARAPGIRHDAKPRSVRRDGQFAAAAAAATAGTAGLALKAGERGRHGKVKAQSWSARANCFFFL